MKKASINDEGLDPAEQIIEDLEGIVACVVENCTSFGAVMTSEHFMAVMDLKSQVFMIQEYGLSQLKSLILFKLVDLISHQECEFQVLFT